MQKLTWRQLAAVGSMLFGLFFGAGNLIFPVAMGQLAGRNLWAAAAGFLITGVGLPLLGVAALGLSRESDLLALSSRVGRGYGLAFTCALYLTIGPFFAIPRCATVSYTVGIAPLAPGGRYREAGAFWAVGDWRPITGRKKAFSPGSQRPLVPAVQPGLNMRD